MLRFVCLCHSVRSNTNPYDALMSLHASLSSLFLSVSVDINVLISACRILTAYVACKLVWEIWCVWYSQCVRHKYCVCGTGRFSVFECVYVRNNFTLCVVLAQWVVLILFFCPPLSSHSFSLTRSLPCALSSLAPSHCLSFSPSLRNRSCSFGCWFN